MSLPTVWPPGVVLCVVTLTTLGMAKWGNLGQYCLLPDPSGDWGEAGVSLNSHKLTAFSCT